MLTLAEVYDIQNKYGVNTTVTDIESTTYEAYLDNCKRTLIDVTPHDYYDWDTKTKNDFTDTAIIQFVDNNPALVDGYYDENNVIDKANLIDKLRLDIIDAGILKQAIDDDEVQEIQINDYKTIYVVKGGKSVLYTDDKGKPYKFVSNEELRSTIDRLIYDPRSTPPRITRTNPLLNTRTADKGYRLSAVGNEAITPDSTVGYNFPCTSVTIRKYAASMLTFTDFERFGSIAPEMSAFLRMCGRADIRLACVGQTSSGKTTLLNAVLWESDPKLRVLLIQNPTEIMLYKRDPASGANTRNALHWEAQDLPPEAAKDPTTPTMENMIAHTLRNTPDIIVPGEVRTGGEFYQMNRALKTGHRVLTTWHARDGADAISRGATELSTMGGSVEEHKMSLANSFDIIVSQQKLGDGKRKVMAIEELTGRIIDGEAETRVLFQYHLTGKSDKDPKTGEITNIYGYFEQCNPISERLVKSFYTVGFTKEDIKDFVGDIKPIEGGSNLPSQKEVARLALSESTPTVTTGSTLSTLDI